MSTERFDPNNAQLKCQLFRNCLVWILAWVTLISSAKTEIPPIEYIPFLHVPKGGTRVFPLPGFDTFTDQMAEILELFLFHGVLFNDVHNCTYLLYIAYLTTHRTIPASRHHHFF